MAEVAFALDEPAVFVGKWWLPANDDHVATGRLTYDPDEGLRLDLESEGHILPWVEETPIVLGITIEGTAVTLRNVVGDQFRSTIAGMTSSGWVGQAIIGAHFQKPQDIRLHSLRAQLTSLTEWAGEPAFDLTNASASGGEIKYRLPALTYLRSGKRALVAVVADVTGLPANRNDAASISLKQRTWLNVDREFRAHIDDLFDEISRFGTFLSFAAGRDCPFLEVTGQASVPLQTEDDRVWSRRPVWLLFPRTVGSVTPTGAADMLFRLDDIRELEMRPFHRWCRRVERLAPIFNLYLAAVPTQTQRIEFRFLALAQALDAYQHRTQRPDGNYVDVVASFVKQLPAPFKRLVPPTFPAVVRDTRNYFTHWNTKYEKRAAKGNQLVRLTFGVKVLLELILLQELGFSQGQIVKLLNHNPRIVGTVRAAFGEQP